MTRSQPMVRHLPSRHTPITPPCRQSTWASSKQLVQPFLTHCRREWNKTNKDLWLETQVNISWPPMLPSASYHLFLPLFQLGLSLMMIIDRPLTEVTPSSVQQWGRQPSPGGRGHQIHADQRARGVRPEQETLQHSGRINLGNLSDKRVAVGCLADLGT